MIWVPQNLNLIVVNYVSTSRVSRLVNLEKGKNQFDYKAMDRDPRANLVYH